MAWAAFWTAQMSPARGSGAGDRIHTGVYLPRDLRRRLREIVAAQALQGPRPILEGVRHVVDRRAISAYSARKLPTFAGFEALLGG